MVMPEITYSFPLPASGAGAAVGANGIFNPAAYANMRGAGVTFFGSMPMAYFVYLGSLMASAGLIVLDYLQITQAFQHDGLTNATLAGETMIDSDGMHLWIVILAWAMLGCDVVVACGQFFDLVYIHFRFWPLTALTWASQFIGMGLATALLATYLFYPHADAAERDYKLAIAIGSLALHAIFVSSQFAVTIEYLIRKVKPM